MSIEQEGESIKTPEFDESLQVSFDKVCGDIHTLREEQNRISFISGSDPNIADKLSPVIEKMHDARSSIIGKLNKLAKLELKDGMTLDFLPVIIKNYIKIK